MAVKLLVFDIDGTLAATEDPIPSAVAEKLQGYARQGLRIVFISGRTASYLAGLARGVGLKELLVAGENGGVIFNPLSKWERKLEAIPHETGEAMKKALRDSWGDLWFQPNQTMLTAAPKDLKDVDALYRAVLKLPPVQEHNYTVNKYYDAVEIMPSGNDKGQALKIIREMYELKKDEVVVFGNTIVDLPMKKETDHLIMIGDNVKDESIQNFASIEEAFVYLDQLIGN